MRRAVQRVVRIQHPLRRGRAVLVTFADATGVRYISDVHALRDLALGFGLLVLLCNLALYAWRARVLRALPPCDREDRLGSIAAGWAFVQECLALAGVVLSVPAGWVMPSVRTGVGTRGPLILVHGWGLNRGSLWWMRRRLLHDGWSPVYCFDYSSFTADVERAAEHLRDHIDRLAAHHQPLMLVGYSLGGLVLRCYARRYPAPRVRRFLTLGTAHGGTELARFGPWRDKLAPGASLMNKLNAVDHVPQQFDVIAIHSTFDAMVLPPANARYPGAFNVQVPDIGHNALLFSSKVYRLIAENLAAPPAG